MGFGNKHTQFEVLFSKHGWDMTVKLESTDFLVTLVLVHVSSKKKVPIETFNKLFESSQNKQQYGTNITCKEVRNFLFLQCQSHPCYQ